MRWPKQSECASFYGDPRGPNGQADKRWMAQNLINLKPPFQMTYAGAPIKTIRVHKACSESLYRALQAIWIAGGKDQKKMDFWGVSIYGGCFNYRLARGLSSLSMHSYGCAIDLDPARNGLKDKTPRFANFPEVLKAFADEGWVWGGKWKRPDGMHFQAARV